MKKDHILITGGTGFVGASLVRRCLDDGYMVTILTRDNKFNWRLQNTAGRFTAVQSDLLNKKLSNILEKIQPNIVIHCAAYGGMPQESDFEKMLSINLMGLHNLINSLKNLPIKLFINTGSSSEYGVHENSMKENFELSPINDYGITKASATLYCEKLRIRDKLPIITLRLFSPYGPLEQPSRLIPTICRAAITGEKITLSSPSFVRDFIYIDDVINAYSACLMSKGPVYGIYNVGSGKQHSIGTVVSTIESITKKKLLVNWNLDTQQTRQIEPSHWKADISKAKLFLHWSPEFSLKVGLKKMLYWNEQNESIQ